MTTFLDNLKFWISTAPEKINMAILGPIDNIQDFVNLAKEFPKISKMMIYGKIRNASGKEVDIANSITDKPSSIIVYSPNLLMDYPFYIYINFLQHDTKKGTFFRNSSNTLDNIFSKRNYRRSCLSLYIDNYSGTMPITNFWTSSEIPEICHLSSWGKLSQELLQITVSEKIIEEVPFVNKKDQLWMQRFTNYLSTILKKIVDPKYVHKFLTEEALEIWTRSMTHKSVNLIYNYESLEYYGDSISKFAFNDYMFAKFNKITTQELTEFSNQYMSKKFQSLFSDDLFLSSWGIYDPIVVINEKLKTDLLEAFTGALGKIGNMVAPDAGILVVNNFYALIGESLSFPKEMIYGKISTQIDQLNQRMESYLNGKVFRLKENSQEEIINGLHHYNTVVTVDINKIFFTFLEDRGISQDLILQFEKTMKKYSHIKRYNDYEKENKEETKDIVYGKIYEEYLKLGITQDFVNHLKRGPFERLEKINRKIVDDLRLKFKPEDFNRLNFYDDNTGGYIIFYLDVYDEHYKISGIESLTYPEEKGKIAPTNLSIVPFPTSIPPEYSGYTTQLYGHLLAVEKYLLS
jgi:dsRNA-specific ribonuclease